jgi:hypothetical protein
MIETIARVPTVNAARFVMNLCRQWPHRIDVNFRDRQGVVHFQNAVATLTPADDQLVVTILANDNSTIERLQGLVATHLDRLASREAPLRFDWQRKEPLTKDRPSRASRRGLAT